MFAAEMDMLWYMGRWHVHRPIHPELCSVIEGVLIVYTISDLYDLEHTAAKEYLSQFVYPWEALNGIKDWIIRLGNQLNDEYEQVSPQVWVHRTATVASTAYLGGYGSTALCLHPRQCAHWRGLCGRQFGGIEECDSV